MTNILVVDDSAVDRKLICTLLAKKTDWEVKVSEDGQSALEELANELPDLVISDLKMPRMDGFQLVGEIKKKYPVVPVIIITSMGSEDLAMQALREGAASFCPKSRMSHDLITISRNVLSISLNRRQTQQVLSRITHSRLRFELENDSSLIAPTIEHLQSHMLSWDETDRLRVGVALDESLLNAMHHGNLEVDSSLRNEGDGSGYLHEIRQRAVVDPFRNRRVLVEAEISEQEIRLRVKDEGPGFKPELVPDPTAPDNLHKPSGRGLLLIKTFMSDVEHNDEGNEITMIKRRDNGETAH